MSVILSKMSELAMGGASNTSYETSYINGDWYSGNWIKDSCEGSGEYHFYNGDVYYGNFHVGKFNGSGKLMYIKGDM